ncbi:Putative DNA-binding protein Roi of bacteriophage BP-933W [Acinetobacter bereziniae]|uniref:phage antirepressor KilAC domain-containing protein n=1 Tax=Acinetobacter bereziniae TaxID=106648 RepID=UPI0005750CA6|nr:phage antirepressor KilAC domain-containing protein [Acinetobacter bereziniae]CEI51520.1 Putative DNA-binding protein Roi of bacteriophage BP-933W [Acinetobacter bereziniae]
MNMITFSEQAKQQTLTMSTRLIAELTGKRHPDVKRDCEVMFTELNLDVSKFAHIYLDSMNRQQTEYLLPKDLVETLITGYSIKLRYQVIQRLHELENQAPKELSRLEILQIAIQAEEQNQALQGQVQILEPKAKALDTLANTEGTYNIRECAKTIGIGERKLIDLLLEKKWIYREDSGRLQPYSTKREAGIFINRTSPVVINKYTGEEKVHLHMRVTAFGLTKITELVNTCFGKEVKA